MTAPATFTVTWQLVGAAAGGISLGWLVLLALAVRSLQADVADLARELDHLDAGIPFGRSRGRAQAPQRQRQETASGRSSGSTSGTTPPKDS